MSESSVSVGSSHHSAAEDTTPEDVLAPCDYYEDRAPTYPNYYSQDEVAGLADFFEKLHSPEGMSNQDYLKVKVVSFREPADDMRSSGVLHWLGFTKFKHIKEPKDPRSRLAGDLGVACDMIRCCLEAHDKDPIEVPVRKWWQIITWLLRRCVNIVTIEVPPEWVEICWYAPRYPQINVQSVRQLSSGRWRWGQDVVVRRHPYDDYWE